MSQTGALLDKYHVDSKERQDAWFVISDLFLDNALDEASIEHLARQLAASPFTMEDLAYIYESEVAPVLHGNLECVAGVWGGFNREEITGLIGDRIIARKAKGSTKGIAIIEKFKREYVLGQTIYDWQKVLEATGKIRSA